MADDPPLFDVGTRRRSRGRVRLGLEVDVKAARDAGSTLSAAGVASLRTLADTIDDLDRLIHASGKPYDRPPLAAVARQFDDTFERVFAAVAHERDPLTRALEEFAATETGDRAGAGAD